MAHKIFILAVLVATFANDGSSKPLISSKCPTYWTAFGDSCYRFFGQHLNLKDASFNCRIHGSRGRFAYLVSIHSQEENDFVATLVKSSTDPEDENAHIWIGLNDEVEEGNFAWSDGTDLDFTEWFPGQPSGGPSQQGVIMRGPREDDFSFWHDDTAGTRYYYVCKLPQFD
ncbi:Echinoidin [Holothuria leucospilota]|uniref:Echinoidin n=1 Tax=Holothuria leucospilota TaxID=206669 RepID=A0A9Q1C567_HOLLE|nr:Echinoidin [Holothuria leucospilota]